MSEVPIESARPERPARNRRRTGGFTIEDLILYVFGAIILALFWIMFGQVQTYEKTPGDTMTSAMNHWQPAPNDVLPLAHLKAQLTNTAMRYEQAMRTSTAISTRRNFGFLVGTLLALLGSLIAIRGARGESIDSDMHASEFVRLKITTTSSGAFIAFLGAAIIMATVLNNDHATVEDKGINLAGSEIKTETITAAKTDSAQATGNPPITTDSVLEKMKQTRPQ